MMNARISWRVRLFNRSQKKRSWECYKKIVAVVVRDHQHEFPEFSKALVFIRAKDIRGLVNWADSLVEQKYSTARKHFLANQLAAIIRKYPFPKDLNPFDPDQEAREKFLSSEEKCSQTNKRFDDFWSKTSFHLREVHSMARFIESTIGSSPDYYRVWNNCDFGPGASIGIHGNATNILRKISGCWSVSPSALQFAVAALKYNFQIFEGFCPKGNGGLLCFDHEHVERRIRERLTIVNHNKIAFVPKTVKTSRSIAVEPLLNGFVQKGVDVVLRNNLKRIGIDLTDQSLNARYARRGSLSNAVDPFVTIDLSSASDSISIGLCRTVLPPDWYYLLDSLRSKNFIDKGDLVPYNKFCSMGNGFCFPLETLLFTSMCAAVGCGRPGVDFLVYGDDIIVRQSHSARLISLLSFCGFEVNARKTFLEGPFRESCGADWFDGEDVRPYILDHPLDSLQEMFKFLNLTKRNSFVSEFFSGARSLVKGWIPRDVYLSRPISYGPVDGSFLVEFDEFLTNPYATYNRKTGTWTWYELITHPCVDSHDGGEFAEMATIYALLRGANSKAPFTMRRMTRTTVRSVTHGR